MMRILVLGDPDSIHTRTYASYWAERGWNVTLAGFGGGKPLDGVEVVSLGKGRKPDERGGNFYYLLHVGELGRLVGRAAPDCIQCHYSYSYGVLGTLSRLLSGKRMPMTVICHGSDILGRGNGSIKRAVNRTVLRGASSIVSVSGEITDRLLGWGLDGDRIFTKQYGVRDSGSGSAVKDIPFLSNRLLMPNSRIAMILETMSGVDFHGGKPVFVLANAGEETLEAYRRDYPAFTFTGRVGHAEMMDLAGRSRVYISATLSDGTALSLLEAMRMGAIPVVSNIPSNRSWIVDSLNGFLFRDARELLEGYRRACGEDAQAMRDMNRSLVARRADFGESMRGIYEFCCRGLP